MTTQKKYSLKRHLLQETTSNPNQKMLQELINGANDFSLITSDKSWGEVEGTEARLEWGEDPCLYMIKLTLDYDDVIFIDTIEALSDEYNDMCEGQGYASDMMRELMELADSHDVQLSLQFFKSITASYGLRISDTLFIAYQRPTFVKNQYEVVTLPPSATVAHIVVGTYIL